MMIPCAYENLRKTLQERIEQEAQQALMGYIVMCGILMQVHEPKATSHHWIEMWVRYAAQVCSPSVQ